MYRKAIFILFITCLTLSALGQIRTDTITMVNSRGGVSYMQSGHMLSLKEISSVVKSDREAYRYLKSAKTLNGFSNAFSYTGGVLIGYPIGYGISTGYFNLNLMAMGCGFVLMAIPVSIAAKHKLKLSIDTYNKKRVGYGSVSEVDLQFGITQNGVGLILTL